MTSQHAEASSPGLQDHLFINYATEDSALAEWLTLKLTAEGFAVWCDRIKLLGGEPYPKDIDLAIKNRTFRFLSLLSHDSIQKPNPMKERTLALNLARERKQDDFLIPLNVSGLKPSELPWMTSDLTFIPFRNWADGLNQLLKKLTSVAAPKPLAQKGREIAAAAFLPRPIISHAPERLITNYFHFRAIPDTIRRYEFPRQPSFAELAELAESWAFRKASPRTLLAFVPPPPERARDFQITDAGLVRWRSADTVDKLKARDVASALLDKSLQQYLLRKGLVLAPDRETIYFPRGLTEGDRLDFIDYKGRKCWLKVLGERSVRSLSGPPKKYAFHLAPNFRIRRIGEADYFAVLRMRIHITDMDGKPLPSGIVNRRRKKVARSWWNHHWLNRQLATLQFLSAGESDLPLGAPGCAIMLSSISEMVEAPFGIDEARLKSERTVPEETEQEKQAPDEPEDDAADDE